MTNSALLDQEALTSSLAIYLSASAGRPVRVTGMTRLSNGWESDVYAFDAPEWQAGSYVLRLYFGSEAAQKALGEFGALQLLETAGYPVPQAALVEPAAKPLGRSFLIMRRVVGNPLGALWRDPDPSARARATDRFCELLASLHTLKWEQLPGAEHIQAFSIDAQFAMWEGFAAQYPVETLRKAIPWLRDASVYVTPQPLRLVHWDFHHENILVGADGRAWVIDWTQLQATDVRFDLAWTLILLASERDPAIAEAVRAGYAAVRGWDEEAVRQELAFFEAAACAKRMVSVLISMQYGADALGMRPGAEAIMGSRLSRIALLYKQWLSLTATPLADMEALVAEHL